MKKYVCHDCSKELKKNEEFVSYKIGENEYCKCKTCHEADSVLRNFQKTEIYSRVVGYIRPVAQWNGGKQAEFADRKEFQIENPACC